MAELTYRDAVARGIAQEMERDPDVVFPGRRYRQSGAASSKPLSGSSISSGLCACATTPISEQAILGAAMGAAMTGLEADRRDHVLVDFIAVCFDYLCQLQYSKKPLLMTNGQVKCPLVVRTANGGKAAPVSARSTARASRTGA